MSVAGKWEGKLLDTSGVAAKVEAELTQKQTAVAGQFSVYFASARDDCGCADWTLAQTAAVKGTYRSRGEQVRLKYVVDLGGRPVNVVFQAKLTKADPHASKALVGSYTVTDEEQELGFEGGACVLWLYRAARR